MNPGFLHTSAGQPPLVDPPFSVWDRTGDPEVAVDELPAHVAVLG
jgi:hypothetical protein